MLLPAAGCSRSATVQEAIEVYDVKTGYDDGGQQSGQNRLLPTISFRVRNKADRAVHTVQFNAVFRVIGGLKPDLRSRNLKAPIPIRPVIERKEAYCA